ncbi:protein of unknown function UPF0157 [Pseudobacteroides cellulosolvens ATCC 35603 = DSM 2933]|uniref:Uncharacterized protein n=1 Tax=Pseudobacteroides cellulosolvens ATCC 35603 = DSM 2933 TaxID=398512 RepID=A0A0L6JJI9_9FIRM|nr:protein of unknown function UPF0157 [Pseudobacteroides cellulosolvens ATCC 35603 = DSM 2933]
MGKALNEMSLEELWQLFPIVLKEHNPAYKQWHIDEKDQIENAVGKNVVKRINHIGSSSVKGLMSKPIIDILMEVSAEKVFY